MNKHKRMQTQRKTLTDIAHSQANRKNRRKHERKPTQYFTNMQFYTHTNKKKTAEHTYKHSHTHAHTHPQTQYLTHRQAQKHSKTLTLSEKEIW